MPNDLRKTPAGGGCRQGGTSLMVLVYLVLFVMAIEQTTIVPLLPELAQRYALTPAATAWILCLPSLAMLVTSTPVGVLGDRIGARPVTVVAAGALCVSAFAQAAPSLVAIVAGRLLFGVAFGAIWTTGLAWLAQLRPDDAPRRLGVAVTASAVGTTAGPTLAGVLAGPAGLGAPFVVCGLAAAAIAVALGVASRSATTVAPAALAAVSMRQILRVAPRRPRIVAGAAALAVSGAVGSVVQLLVPLQLNGVGASVGKIGLALSASALLYIAASALTVHLGPRLITRRAIAWTSLVLVVVLIPAALSSGTVWVLGTLLLTSLPRAAIGAVAYPLATRRSEEGALGAGAVIGLLNSVWAAVMVVAPLAAGLISESLGRRDAYAALAVAGFVVAGYVLVAATGFHRRRSTPRRLVRMASAGRPEPGWAGDEVVIANPSPVSTRP